MIVNIHDAKTHFSKYINKVLLGEEMIIAKNGKPIVKMTPLSQRNEKRTPGLSCGQIEISDSFDDPLDRMLIAQAMAENMVIASKDSLIRQYDGVMTLW
ncbi:type II toxin-antitoxin system prevent-host-death family antitoxin [Oceanispirochaeta sp.]|jgi:prevent-host-death family protein|uniref:type II toxin-antitoxin system prevent-host-death family antitoxin n=1 Tax=Oceanispirochaeta sp. TaxID=2035350 RepID=UPI00263929E6|nr:type II toxin-antitoxin system prevent-host-death family antitoxin [Oceanispirochaeta sp.]MDA3959129.1 type II toxin-antitoxin system prevent-host-death family antitoxin [Oceanispirochaeta sp.]